MTFGHPSFYLAAEEDGNLVGVLPLTLVKSLVFGRFLVSVPYACYGGICANNDSVRSMLLEKAKKIAKETNVDYLQIRTADSLHDTDFISTSDKVTFEADLSKSLDLYWENKISNDAKSDVRKALSSGCEVSVGRIEYLNDFYKIFCRRMHDLGSPAYGKNFFENIMKVFQDDAKIVLISRNKKPIGAGFLIVDDQRIEMPWSAALSSDFKYKPNHLIYWKAIQYGFERRCQTFDFGTSNQDSQNAAFKLQWGAGKIQLAWSYHLVRQKKLSGLNPKNPQFSFAIQMWKKMPRFFVDYVGPKLVRGIP